MVGRRPLGVPWPEECRSARYALGVTRPLTLDTLDLPYLTSARFTPRTTGIPLGDCVADEWMCTFGEHGIAGWASLADIARRGDTSSVRGRRAV
jgi:hypothetical protein